MNRFTHVAFGLASFFGAFLLFLVQPLMGKQILPWFGGSSATWSTCLLFFQVGLVAGYAYAHVTRRLTVGVQAAGHVALLLTAVAIAPVALPVALKPTNSLQPATQVLWALAWSVGLPYGLLAATAPLIQDWYARSQAGETPYRLYVPSNIGSVGALLLYPFVVEPSLTVGQQTIWWRTGLLVFAVLCAACAWLAIGSRRRSLAAATSVTEPVPPASATDRMLWVLLAAAGSALLLATTNQLSQDIAVVPMLWVVPLALYLGTFIVCFADLYRRRIWVALLAGALVWSAWVVAAGSTTSLSSQSAALLALLTAGCMVCHGELVRLQPHPSHLTRFYLAMSIGGSLGGIFVALVAPVVFETLVELPLVAALIPLLLVVAVTRDRFVRQARLLPLAAWALPLLLFTGALGWELRQAGSGPRTIAVRRDFYGVVRVIEDPAGNQQQRGMLHGRILHGAQFVAADLRRQVGTYYAPGSGIDRALTLHPRRVAHEPMKIGVIGLGVGTLAGLANAGDEVRFFELSPAVIDFARRHFTYMADSAATSHIVPGDGRLSLERELSQPGAAGSYDLFVVDAFAGDSIPVHLLTRESVALYHTALAPDGVVAFNISNRHVDLGAVVRALAAEVGWRVHEIRQAADPARRIRENRWVIATAGGDLANRFAEGAEPDSSRRVVWTDAFSPLLPVITWR